MNIEDLKPLILFSKGTFIATGEHSGAYDDGEFEEFELNTFSRISKKMEDEFESAIQNVLESILSEEGYSFCYEEGGRGEFKIWYDGKLHWKINHYHRYIEIVNKKLEGTYIEPSTPQSK